jgi:RNA polymerase sigma factor (sigma-70 family)
MGEAGGSSVSDATVEAHIIQLLERYQAKLHSFAFGMVGERELARDIVQETFIAAWRVACDRKAPFGDPCDEKGVRRWLFAVAYRQSALVLRRQRRIVRPLDQDGVDDMASASPDIATSVVEADALRAALSALRPLDAAVSCSRRSRGSAQVRSPPLSSYDPRPYARVSRERDSAYAPPTSLRVEPATNT